MPKGIQWNKDQRELAKAKCQTLIAFGIDGPNGGASYHGLAEGKIAWEILRLVHIVATNKSMTLEEAVAKLREPVA